LRRAHLFGACEGLNLSRACGGLIFWAPAAGYYLPRLRRANFCLAPAAAHYLPRLRRAIFSAPAAFCSRRRLRWANLFGGSFRSFGACGGLFFWRLRRANIVGACGELLVSALATG